MLRICTCPDRAAMQAWGISSASQEPAGPHHGPRRRQYWIEDSYKSPNEALYHGGFRTASHAHQMVEPRHSKRPRSVAARRRGRLLVPGDRRPRHAGMMQAAQIAASAASRTSASVRFPVATVDYARHVAGLADADSTEGAPETPKLITMLRDLLAWTSSAARRLAHMLRADPGSLRARLRRKPHPGAARHRYEFNCLYERR